MAYGRFVLFFTKGLVNLRRRWFFTGICLAALLAIFIRWWLKTPPVSLPAAFSSVFAAALFAIIGIRFIPLWMEAWSGSKDYTPVIKIGYKLYLKIFSAAFLSRLLILALSLLIRYIIGSVSDPFSAFKEIWTSGDGLHYVDIAQNWYRSEGRIDDIVRLVFLPMYPILIKGVAYITGHYFISAILVSVVSFSLASCILYKVARLDMDHDGAVRAVKYLIILPSSFFYSAPMSDSLFLLLSVTCIYFIRRKEYLTAAVFGGLAAFTRSLGLALIAPVLFEFISDTIYEVKAKRFIAAKTIIHFISLLIIPLGFCMYLYINYKVSGNPFQYMIYQSEHWSQNLGYFFNTTAYMVSYSIDSFKNGHSYWSYGLWWPNLIFIFGSLLLMVKQVRKLRPSYTAYYITYFTICIGATWLLSGPRYLASMFPLSLAAAELSEKRSVENTVTFFFIAGAFYYLWAYVNCWSVY